MVKEASTSSVPENKTQVSSNNVYWESSLGTSVKRKGENRCILLQCIIADGRPETLLPRVGNLSTTRLRNREDSQARERALSYISAVPYDS